MTLDDIRQRDKEWVLDRNPLHASLYEADPHRTDRRCFAEAVEDRHELLSVIDVLIKDALRAEIRFAEDLRQADFVADRLFRHHEASGVEYDACPICLGKKFDA